jgi:hypothetical protein
LNRSFDPLGALSNRLASAPFVWISWHDEQAREPSRDKPGSANRRSPRESFSGSAAGGGGKGVIGSWPRSPDGPTTGDCSCRPAAAAVSARINNSSAKQLPASGRLGSDRAGRLAPRLQKRVRKAGRRSRPPADRRSAPIFGGQVVRLRWGRPRFYGPPACRALWALLETALAIDPQSAARAARPG